MANLRQYDGTSRIEEMELQRSGRKPLYAPTEKIGIVEVANFPPARETHRAPVYRMGDEEPGRRNLAPHREDPRAFHQVGDAHPRAVGDEGYPVAACRRGDRRVKAPGHEVAQLRADRRILPHQRRAAQQLSLVRQRVLYQGLRPLRPRRRSSSTPPRSGFPPARRWTRSSRTAWSTSRSASGSAAPSSSCCRRTSSTGSTNSAWSTRRRSARWGASGSSSAGSGPTAISRSTCRGSSVYSVTRLTGTNYETQAAAATDLGGIEISRTRLVITIGLATITYNPGAVAIIIAAGEAKAAIVRLAVENEKGPQYPASVLQDLPNARFYLTRGAASLLTERRFEDFCKESTLTPERSEDVVTTLAISAGKQLVQLTKEDFEGDRFAAELLRKSGEETRRARHRCAQPDHREDREGPRSRLGHDVPSHRAPSRRHHARLPRPHLPPRARPEQQALLREPHLGVHVGLEPVLSFDTAEARATIWRRGRCSRS